MLRLHRAVVADDADRTGYADQKLGALFVRVVAADIAALGGDFPGRVVHAGLAVQHAVGIASGLAGEGLKPFLVMGPPFPSPGLAGILEAVATRAGATRLVLLPHDDSGVGGEVAHRHGDAAAAHETMRGLIVNELNVDPARVMPVLHYDGTPITARFITAEIGERIRLMNVEPLKKGKAA